SMRLQAARYNGTSVSTGPFATQPAFVLRRRPRLRTHEGHRISWLLLHCEFAGQFRRRRQSRPLPSAKAHRSRCRTLNRSRTSLRAKAFVLAPDSGTVYEIDAGPLAISRRARAGNLAAAMQISQDLKSLWVLYQDPPSLVEFPLETMRAGRRIR